jgi:hypothetical protein
MRPFRAICALTLLLAGCGRQAVTETAWAGIPLFAEAHQAGAHTAVAISAVEFGGPRLLEELIESAGSSDASAEEAGQRALAQCRVEAAGYRMDPSRCLVVYVDGARTMTRAQASAAMAPH